MSTQILTEAKFKKWLEKKHPRTRVGQPGRCLYCPIAKFLTQSNGEQYEVDGVYFATDEDYWELPLWAKKFTIKIDSIKTPFITAKKALELLKAA